MAETLRPVEVSDYYINRVASGMCKYFWDNIFSKIFDILAGNNTVYNYNPYHDEKGRFCSEIMAKMPKISDYKNPTKDYELSPIPQEFLDKLGKVQKPLVLKKNIIKKNKSHHPEISVEEYNEILLNGIYKADVIFKTNSGNEYYNFVHYKENKNEQVLIELSETKNNYEIVNFYKLDDKGLSRKIRKAIERVDNEGGQVLIDIKETLKVGALSNLEIDSIHIINDATRNFNPSVYNSKDDVINAIRNGSIWYENGAFRAKNRFSNAVATTLEKMGAKFRNGAYFIQETAIPWDYWKVIELVRIQSNRKADEIARFLKGLGAVLPYIDLKTYIQANVELMYRKLELDIITSAQEKQIPVIELGIVQPKVNVPKAKTIDIEKYWEEKNKEAAKLYYKWQKAADKLDKAKKEKGISAKDYNDAVAEEEKTAKALAEFQADKYQNAPQLDITIDDVALDAKSKKIAEDYTYNMKYWVQKWEAKNIIKMREDILKMVQQGARVERLQEYFEKRWGIAKNKAKFLAENESHLAASVIKATEYQAMGCTQFKWGRSSSKEKRKLHEEYYGKIFRFDETPIIDEKLGIKGLPRQIWNCKCHMLIVVPSLDEMIKRSTEVKNEKRNIFKRIWNSTQRNNNAWRYRRLGQGAAL